MRRGFLVLALFVVLAVAACGGSSGPAATETDAEAQQSPGAPAPPAEAAPEAPATPEPAPTPSAEAGADAFGPAPEVPTGPPDPAAVVELDAIFADLSSRLDPQGFLRVAESGDPRLAWIISDFLRFISPAGENEALLDAFAILTGSELVGPERDAGRVWLEITNRLIAWDIPAAPGYVDYKRQLFTLVEPGWAPFFADEASDLDWRLISWGGVFIDDRPLGDRLVCPRGCIPALDDPAVTGPDEGDWYPDEAIVFGVVHNGEARAYPKNIMEVHEMVNDTLGGRRIGMPYCTLCGSAQAYFTDTAGDTNLVLRTSGLLARSNKVMYELGTKSVFDTFNGRALSGPLRESGVQLDQLTVVTATWGDWKAAHPDTTIVARDGGLGRSYPLDPLRGRDDDGPIFPIGDADPRLPVHESVIGVITPDGQAVAFPAGQARLALEAGEGVELAGVRLRAASGGLVAESLAGEPLASHQSFWFAWSQFHEDTELWSPS